MDVPDPRRRVPSGNEVVIYYLGPLGAPVNAKAEQMAIDRRLAELESKTPEQLLEELCDDDRPN